MPDEARQAAPFDLATRDLAVQWLILVLLSVLFGAALVGLQVPAGLLLGPMAAAVLVAVGRGRVRVPRRPFLLAQASIGCLIAQSITLPILHEIGRHWPTFGLAVVAVIAASSLLGWLLARGQILPGTTAIWGSAPGAATAMVLMAESFGADVRLVAFMQYLRVVIVTLVASLVASFFMPEGAGGDTPGREWFAAADPAALAVTLGVIALGAVIGQLSRLPAGPLLVTLLGATLLQDLGGVTLELPAPLLAVSYAFVGWNIGLRFDRTILVHVARSLPGVLVSIFCLVGICGGFAALLVVFAGLDPLTAYLATSPGGADSVAIIAASTHVDMAYVMAMQLARFVLVLLFGPHLARLIAGQARRRRPEAP
ncbi:AbrB family transcriptional regulator [Modicisalibacter tunisiensis]|uniref:AbrB family transcriptional regulator n=1 Tax=Modicisalibacter tunisiensis TaxID=390637 RepID=A0ABS7X5D1_9GAMM|nr:AbrB family transcriptional regulator [Modicisalibacter tunisiensis]MBZ9537421.1 AbrB family transcriptional regulator [Modicisalibacter tunisiensis]MBZ9569156.1 AbrB family transcriptional regulator [Modicisalibacter tunisiensis]